MVKNLKTSWLKQDWTLTEKNKRRHIRICEVRGCESVQCFIQSKRGEQRVVMYTQFSRFNIINSDEKCLSAAFLFTTKTRRWRAKSRSLIIKPSINTVFCFHCWDETNMSVFCCWIFKQLIIFFHNYAFSPSTTKTTRDKNHFHLKTKIKSDTSSNQKKSLTFEIKTIMMINFISRATFMQEMQLKVLHNRLKYNLSVFRVKLNMEYL